MIVNYAFSHSNHGMKMIRITVLFATTILCASLVSSCSTLTGKKSVSKQQILDSEMGIIMSYLNSGETRLALTRIENARKKYPKNPDLLNLMGLSQMALTNSNVAIKYFKMAYKQDPMAHTLLNLSSAYLTLKKYKSARNALNQAIRIEPEYSHRERIYHNIAYTHQKERNYKNAIKYYRKALAINPTYHKSWQEIAQSYESLKQNKKAIYAYQKARNFCENCYSPNLALTKAYLRMNQPRSAIKTIRKYLNIEGISAVDEKKARNVLTKLSRSKRRL